MALTAFVCLAEPSIFGSMDWLSLHIFYKTAIRDAVLAGRLPLWTPHVLLGRPLLADADAGLFYPPELLYVALGPFIGCAISCALHYFICLYGTLKLARAVDIEPRISMGVAFVFAASAPIVGSYTSGYIHYGPAICFIPLALYLGLRWQATHGVRSLALLALVLGCQHMCGHPQPAWLTTIGLFVFVLGRRIDGSGKTMVRGCLVDAGALTAAVALGAALAAVHLLPLGELATQGNRHAPSLEFSGAFAEPWFGWFTLLVPADRRYFHFQANAQLYAGAATVLFGSLGLCSLRERSTRALWGLLVFFALLAAGNATPVFKAFFHLIPGLSWFRLHSRGTIFVTLALVLAAGRALSRPAPRPAREVRLLLGTAIALLGGAIAFVGLWPGFAGAVATQSLVCLGLFGATAAIGVVWFRARPGRTRTVLEIGLALLLLVDLGLATAKLKQQNRGNDDEAREVLVRRLLMEGNAFNANGVPPRIFFPYLRENAGVQQGWSAPTGYVSLNLGRVWNYIHEAVGVTPPAIHNTFPSPLLTKLGPIPYPSMALIAGIDPRTHRVATNPQPDPPAYLAQAARMVPHAGEATQLMRAGHDFHSVALVEQPIALPVEAAVPSPGSATIERFEAERIVVSVQSSTPALLVLAEPWYPGWTATIDGVASACIPVNAWMRGVMVPAGARQIVFQFHSTYLKAGAGISIAALLLVAFLLIRRKSLPG
jgi:hypothetical protein